MKDHERKRIEQFLKGTFPSIGTRIDTGLRHDLWPAMLKRLDEPSPPVPWFDWALLAAVAALLVCFPGAIPVLLYHL